MQTAIQYLVGLASKINDTEASDIHDNNYGKLGTQSKSYLPGRRGEERERERERERGGGGGGQRQRVRKRERQREGWVGKGKVYGIAGITGVACENTYGHCASYINIIHSLIITNSL